MRFSARSNWLTLVLIVTMLFMCLAQAKAQSPNLMREFINEGPWIPLLTGEPVDTVSSSTKQVIYTNQPDAGDTFTLTYPGRTDEVYEFYSGTYTGSNNGIAISSSADVTYSTMTTRVNLLSDLVKVSLIAGSNRLTFYSGGGSGLVGPPANSIRLDFSNVANVSAPTSGTFTGGVIPRAGRKGSIVMGLNDSGSSYSLWVRTADTRLTSDVWKQIIVDDEAE